MGGWAVWVTRCLACGHPSVAVAEVQTPLPFECAQCGEMAVVRDPERADAVDDWIQGNPDWE